MRALRDEGVRPDQVRWRIVGEDDGGGQDLFEADDDIERRAEPSRAEALAPASAMPLPRSFVDAAREVFVHADPRRLPLIHRLALRIADDARAWDDPLHEDRWQFERMHCEVKREVHKTHAFVRFRRLDEPEPAGVDGEGARPSDAPVGVDARQAGGRHVKDDGSPAPTACRCWSAFIPPRSCVRSLSARPSCAHA